MARTIGTVVAIVGWLDVFALLWYFELVQVSPVSILHLVIAGLVAIGATAAVSEKK